jgi:hypothetical protein
VDQAPAGGGPDNEYVLQGQSRGRKHPPPPRDARVIARILEIRDQPLENLRRTPGPKTILSYLQRDAEWKERAIPTG